MGQANERRSMTETEASVTLAVASAPVGERTVYRHRLPVRLWHWLNAVAIIALFMSGLMIFNAHQRLYWGHYGAHDDAAWLQIDDRGDTGYLRVGSLEIPTTGVLGLSRNADGSLNRHAFPHWLTLPGGYDLAGARRYHFFFAWFFGLGFLGFFLWTVLSRHMTRDLGVRAHDLSPRHLWDEVKDHARLRFPTGEAAARFNTLQKLSYVGVLFVLIPMMILTGLTMSPGMDASWPWLVDLFGGRQSARSLHFIACWALFAFFIVHILMVLLAGPINEIRSMITGWFRLPPDRVQADEAGEAVL
jgi:thiosulfate reductase cytochrome b subunit